MVSMSMPGVAAAAPDAGAGSACARRPKASKGRQAKLRQKDRLLVAMVHLIGFCAGFVA
jgi:hypothetical protein